MVMIHAWINPLWSKLHVNKFYEWYMIKEKASVMKYRSVKDLTTLVPDIDF